MLKIYSIIIGENPKYTATFQPASKRKVALYANCLIVPIILWYINGYLLVTNVLEGTTLSALLTAFIAALIIFLIERAILMSNGSKSIFWFRLVLGFIVASLGSISLDEVIFEHDIDNQIADYKQARIDSAIHKVESNFGNLISSQRSIVTEKYHDWQERLDNVDSEMKGGPHSSGYRGKGEIANENIRMAALLQSDYNTETAKLAVLVSNADIARANARAKVESDFNGNALLVRIRALFDLIAKDKVMLGVYILITLFLFCLEFLVVLIKVGSKSSIDEELEKAREKLLRAKTQKTLERSEIFFKPEHLASSVKDANGLMKQNLSSLFR